MPEAINEDLVTFLGVDESDVEKGVKRANQALDSFALRASRSAIKAGQSMQRFGRTLTLTVTAPLVALSASLVKTASDAEETAQKFGVVFRDVSKAANAAAKSLAAGFGVASDEAEMLLGNTGDLLTGFGFTQQAALDLSIQTNRLAGDLASFANVEGGARRASESLTKALLGETESAKSLGIVIRQDTKEFKDLVAGIQIAENVTLQQAKAIAILGIATEQSKNAIGDFERSQNSTANQTKIFAAELRDLRVDIGRRLIPAYRQLLALGRDLVKNFTNASDATKQQVIQFAALAAAIGPVLLVGGTVLVFLGSFTAAMITATASVASFALSVAGTVSAMVVAVAPFLAVGAAIAAAVGVLGLLLANLIGFRNTSKIVFEGLTSIWTAGANMFSDFVEFMTGGQKDLADSTKTAVEFIGTAWIGLKTVYLGVSKEFAQFARFMTKTAFRFASSMIKALDFIPFFDAKKGLGTSIDIALAGVLPQIDKQIADIESKIKGIPFELLNVPGAIQKDAQKFRDAFQVVLDQIESVPLVGKAKEIVADIRAAFDSLGMLGESAAAGVGGGGAAVGVGGGLGAGISRGLQGFLDQLTKSGKITQEWAEFVIAAVNSVSQAFTDMFVSVIQGTGNFAKSLGGLLTQMAKMIIDIMFKMIFEAIAMQVVKILIDAAAAAGHPFLIPIMVGVALAAVGGILAGTGFEGAASGAGGGAAPAPPAPPITTASVVEAPPAEQPQDTEGGDQQVTLVLEEGSGNELMKFMVRQTKNGIGDGLTRLQLADA
jgi:hypothetical protein